MKASFVKILTLATLVSATAGLKIVLGNDDGWHVPPMAVEYDALMKAGHQVILSAPATDKSGTGRSSGAPATLTTPCEFDTCPVGSLGVGTDKHDNNIHYINAFPGDAARYGIELFAQDRWGTKPDIFVGGTNIGNNMGNVTRISGTVGACAAATADGVPAFAFSGDASVHVSDTTLKTDPHAQTSIDANIWAALVLDFLSVYLDDSHNSHNSHPFSRSDAHSNPHSTPKPSPIVPPGTIININFSNTTKFCNNRADNFQWIATRVFLGPKGVDTERCGSTTLPDETTVSGSGCYATVSVLNGTSIDDVPAAEQKAVFDKLDSLLTCYHH